MSTPTGPAILVAYITNTPMDAASTIAEFGSASDIPSQLAALPAEQLKLLLETPGRFTARQLIQVCAHVHTDPVKMGIITNAVCADTTDDAQYYWVSRLYEYATTNETKIKVIEKVLDLYGFDKTTPVTYADYEPRGRCNQIYNAIMTGLKPDVFAETYLLDHYTLFNVIPSDALVEASMDYANMFDPSDQGRSCIRVAIYFYSPEARLAYQRAILAKVLALPGRPRLVKIVMSTGLDCPTQLEEPFTSHVQHILAMLAGNSDVEVKAGSWHNRLSNADSLLAVLMDKGCQRVHIETLGYDEQRFSANVIRRSISRQTTINNNIF